MQKGGTLSVNNAQVLDCILCGTARILQGGVMSGTSVYNTGILQVNTGGTIDESLVSANGTITVSSGGIARATLVESGGTLTVGSGGIAEDTKIGNGTVEVANGGTARNVSVAAGGSLTVKSGGKFSGRLSAETKATVVFQNGGIMDFNLSAFDNAATACVNLSQIEGTPNYTLTVSGKEKSGTYKLAEGAKGFDRTLGVKDTNGNAIGILDVKGEFTVGNAVYQLNLNKSTLMLKVIANDPPTVTKVKANITNQTTLDVIVTAVFSDDRGLASSLYRIGETGEWKTYEKSGVTVTENATVFFKAVDNAGNESEIVSYEVTNIDKSTLDNGYNNWLYDKSKENKWNYLLKNSVPATIAPDTDEICLDEKGSITMDGKHNFVGLGDAVDFRKIKLDHAAKISFAINATDAVSFTIWNMTEGKGGIYSQKSLQSTVLKKAKDGTGYTAQPKALLLGSGDYYISVQSTNKKSGYSLYNVNLDDSVFFTDGDNSDDWTDMKTNGGGSGEYAVFGTVNTGTTIVLEDWVGFGDSVDYARIHLDTAASLNFALNAADAAKFSLYSLIEKTDSKGVTTYSLKSLQSTTLKKPKNAGEYTATTKPLLLESGDYYIAMESTNAKKGGNAYYTVELGASIFYDAGDDGWNNYVYDKKAQDPLNPDKDAFITTDITFTTEDILLDCDVADAEWSNFVGFGDAADYAKITLSNDATLSFNLTASDAAKFIIYRLIEGTGKKAGTFTLKQLQATTLKKAKDSDVFSADTKALAMAEGEYYICMQSTNAKKGGAAFYNVKLNKTASSGFFDVFAPASCLKDASFESGMICSVDDAVGTLDELDTCSSNNGVIAGTLFP